MIWRKLQKMVFVTFLILIIVFIVLYQIFGDSLDLESIRIYLKNFGIWAPVVFILIYALGTIFIPSTPFMAIAGILFGFKFGLIYTLIGGFLSSFTVFNTSRKLGKERVEKILTHKYLSPLEKYNKRLESGGFWDLVILRVIPIMPFNVLNILMGVSRIKTENYLLGTIIGLIPSNVLAVYFGDFMAKLF